MPKWTAVGLFAQLGLVAQLSRAAGSRDRKSGTEATAHGKLGNLDPSQARRALNPEVARGPGHGVRPGKTAVDFRSAWACVESSGRAEDHGQRPAWEAVVAAH